MRSRFLAPLMLLLILAVLPAWAEGSKPRVLLLATGGTIAGVASPTSALNYEAGRVPARDLLRAVPEIQDLAEITPEQVSQIGSQDMTDEIWLRLARRIETAFKERQADAVVITHGTDTLEETAFFLEQVLSSDRPVVLVGAMRPSNARSADGPANLYEAVQVATSPEARGRGVLVVLNDQVFESRQVTKTHTSALQAFEAPGVGPVGTVEPGSVRFLEPAAPYPRPRFALPAQGPLPRVDIVYGHSHMTADPIREALAGGARGLVLAGVGDGNTSKAALEALAEAAARGIPVVRSTRVGSGVTHRNAEVDDDRLGLAASLDLNPQKARILLQLLIQSGVTGPRQVQEAFEVR